MTYGAIDDGASISQMMHVEDGLSMARLSMAHNTNTTGYCVDCDQPIPQKRLDAVPNAARCVKCQSEADTKFTFTFKNTYIP